MSHHDPELTFNHSFIEPPSSGWVTEGSSFDSDEEEAEALYCVPPREGRSRDTEIFAKLSCFGGELLLLGALKSKQKLRVDKKPAIV